MNVAPEGIKGVLNFSVSSTNLQIKAVLRSGKYSIQNTQRHAQDAVKHL